MRVWNRYIPKIKISNCYMTLVFHLLFAKFLRQRIRENEPFANKNNQGVAFGAVDTRVLWLSVVIGFARWVVWKSTTKVRKFGEFEWIEFAAVAATTKSSGKCSSRTEFTYQMVSLISSFCLFCTNNVCAVHVTLLLFTSRLSSYYSFCSIKVLIEFCTKVDR